MKAYRKLCISVLAVFVCIIAVSDIFALGAVVDGSREYRVQIERLCTEMQNGGAVDYNDYPLITDVLEDDGTDTFVLGKNSDYVLREINGKLYRIEYTASSDNHAYCIIILNAALAAAFIVTVVMYIAIGNFVIKPFERIKNVPYELAKGNLTIPLKERKSRFFGRFIWGLDLLRERLEEQKSQELKLQKDKQTLLLSVSHDIKTPLSAIRLYSQALSRNLYTDSEKQQEVAESICRKTDEIESYINQIIHTAREDFISFEVNNGEFYLSEVLGKIEKYYKEKLALIKTEFAISDYTDCILCGDLERTEEILQNIIENAIKYGDGKYISISFDDEENCRLISVRNSGYAPADSEITHIFDSFYRGSNSKNISGSGLGLYISRQLANKMGGEIFAEYKNNEFLVTLVMKKA